MSDTSGFGGFGPSTRKIRKGIQIVFGPPKTPPPSPGTAVEVRFGPGPQPPAGEKRKAKSKAGGGDGGDAPLLTNVVWSQMKQDQILEDVLLPDEILYYLEAMARFIFEAKRGGVAAALKEFELREGSKFPSLRRTISRQAPGNSESDDHGSEQHSRAGGAFNSGSAKWAQEMSGVTDPTQITIQRLVDVIRAADQYRRALLLSARSILQEYGERVIRGLTREDDPWGDKATTQLIKEFHRQLDAFFVKHGSPTEWEPKKIATTLESFPKFITD